MASKSLESQYLLKNINKGPECPSLLRNRQSLREQSKRRVGERPKGGQRVIPGWMLLCPAGNFCGVGIINSYSFIVHCS